MKALAVVRVTESVEFFEDKWSYSTESHYTNDWTEEFDNEYRVEVEVDEDLEILTENTEIEKRLGAIIEGEMISWEVIDIV